MSDFTMTIGGDRRAAAKTFGVVNPSTGEVHEEAPDCSREQLDEAMDAAAKAYIDWREDIDARRQALQACANLMFGAGGEIGPLLVREQGKPLAQGNVGCLRAR